MAANVNNSPGQNNQFNINKGPSQRPPARTMVRNAFLHPAFEKTKRFWTAKSTQRASSIDIPRDFGKTVCTGLRDGFGTVERTTAHQALRTHQIYL
jgi:hypothetical protein